MSMLALLAPKSTPAAYTAAQMAALTNTVYPEPTAADRTWWADQNADHHTDEPSPFERSVTSWKESRSPVRISTS